MAKQLNWLQVDRVIRQRGPTLFSPQDVRQLLGASEVIVCDLLEFGTRPPNLRKRGLGGGTEYVSNRDSHVDLWSFCQESYLVFHTHQARDPLPSDTSPVQQYPDARHACSLGDQR
jgi:hypothetical protein